ncbi:hypothetical protein SETIT_2G251000v2 [Setaria italica]|uniref:Uncharacterized protein n=1 Tax=Setaria italica TaxID=4555 RepID=A0A368Q2D7_SETIT|nr:hypothetical protein SETIT_2G251000v2 [Setaria italica]
MFAILPSRRSDVVAYMQRNANGSGFAENSMNRAGQHTKNMSYNTTNISSNRGCKYSLFHPSRRQLQTGFSDHCFTPNNVSWPSINWGRTDSVSQMVNLECSRC